MANPTTTPASSGGTLAWKDKLIEYVITHAGALFSAAVIVVVGFIAAGWIGKLVERWLSRKAMEPPVRMLLTRIIRLLVMVLALLIALGTAGMDVTVVVTFMGVAGVGIGLAMQGVLGNIFAGLTIILTKPFRVGEYIEIAGVSGQVKHIEMLSTMLLHTDMSHVMVPNRKLIGEILHNYGQIRQLELGVGVGYSTDMAGAQKIVRGILAANPRVLKEPAPFVGITDLGDFSIQITIKPWVNVADYLPAQVEIYEEILNQFRANKIEIPFPQREVRLLNQN
ncbi:MAG TPA: mechanosensitive ion channel domain-containing protein [Candidatus Paceibacterota bacterium]|nr:mechanosensitive ion channel domain-containing protein [Candidatus Paceibacterota bacterium]